MLRNGCLTLCHVNIPKDLVRFKSFDLYTLNPRIFQLQFVVRLLRAVLVIVVCVCLCTVI